MGEINDPVGVAPPGTARGAGTVLTDRLTLRGLPPMVTLLIR
jgi:hypothetical protein